MPSLDDLNAFLAVAEYGNFTKAAAHLGISSPTLSRIVQGLEEQIGLRLVNRTTRSVALTKAGEHLVDRIRPVMNDYVTALESINSLRDKPTGTLRILVYPGPAQFVFVPKLPKFLANFPEITIEISTNQYVDDIVAGHFDAGISIGNSIDNDMIAVRICDDMRVITVASPAYLARHPHPQSPADLKDHNCIRFRQSTGAFSPWRFLVDGKQKDFDVNGSLIVCETALSIRAAVGGVGLARVIADYAAPFIAGGQLVEILEEWAMPVAAFYLYYPSRRQVPAALQALIDFLKKDFKLGRSVEAA